MKDVKDQLAEIDEAAEEFIERLKVITSDNDISLGLVVIFSDGEQLRLRPWVHDMLSAGKTGLLVRQLHELAREIENEER